LLFGATQLFLGLIAAKALFSLCNCARVTLALMANSFTKMLTTVEHLLADLLTRMLGTLAYVTRNALCCFAAVTEHWHIDIAGRTSSRMTKYIAVFMLAVFIPFFVTIFAT
jgi:hypothetical protein